MTDRVKELIEAGGLPLSVLYTPEKGRYLVAAKDIACGACVVKEVPFVAAVNEKKIEKVCDGCYSHSQSSWSIHCIKCNKVYYCSEACREKEKEIHQLECDYFSKLVSTQVDDIYFFEIIKLMVRFCVRKRSSTSKVIFPASPKKSDIGPEYIANLVGHTELATIGEAPKALEYVTKLLGLNESEREEIKAFYCAEETNSFGFWGKGECALGVFTFGSYYNHSCEPNLIRREADNSIEFVAATDIPAGTEVNISYIDIAQSYSQRQAILKKLFFFECGCARCKFEAHSQTPAKIFDTLISLTCPDASCSNYHKPLDPPIATGPFPLSHHCSVCGHERLTSHIWVKHNRKTV